MLSFISKFWLFVIPRTIAHRASLSFTIFQSLLKLMCIELVLPSNHLILCHPFLLCFQSFLASGSFPMSRVFESASVSVLPMNIQVWFPLGWTGLISKGLSRVFCSTTIKSINSSVLSLPYGPTLTSIHDYWKNP